MKTIFYSKYSKNPFAILTSENDGKIEVTHLPINRFKDGKLYGHLAKANIHSSIDKTKEVCFIFNGEHAYISPTYYEKQPLMFQLGTIVNYGAYLRKYKIY